MSNTPSGPAFRRLDTATRRRQLLATGAALFATQPYDEVWVDDVARTAGISRGLLYHYFGSKRGFLSAVVEQEAATLLAVTEPDDRLPPPERLRAVLDAYLDYVRAHPHGYRALFRGALGADTAIRSIVDGNLARQQERVLRAVVGPGPAPEPVRLAVRGWLSFLVAVCLDWLENPVLDRTAVRELCADTLTGALGASGHGAPPTPGSATDAGHRAPPRDEGGG
ncbi:TetR/AcrR family transcriptional regulator [Pseudonocardia alni subsp. carboxydivorans]|uniref:TetR/AcrR family transcriptional regulator n=1 Tax=Pseudonocardia alni subsp. carboxydivorans TaxID=415010 RepID=A0ABU9AAH8_PSEA5